jgi:DNA mismatch repair protein MutL
LELTPSDAVLLTELLPDMELLGYKLEPFGNNTFVIQGTPADIQNSGNTNTIEKILEQYKHFSTSISFSKREKLLRSMALQQSIKVGVTLSQTEMKQLVDGLFLCAISNISPNGKPTYMSFKKDEMDKLFGR